jgi:transposase-like protein
MGKIKRKFDVQFKIQVCQAIENGTASVNELCQQHQLQRPTVEGWLAKYVSGDLEKRSPDRLRQLEKENEKLLAKVGQLTMTVDLLKKVDDWRRQQKSAALPVITSKNLALYQKPAGPSDSPPRASTTSRKKREP